ncbi:VOC family protein [Candidatus Bathyarchaeota archaeon]|nr:VOC family protein [Candidatus Bathyarchaeota archaeon]
MNPYGSITFFYYNDLKKANEFYQNKLQFTKVIDVDFAQVYKICEGVHVGLVDGQRGSIRPSIDKPVMLSLFVQDLNEWYKRIKEKGVEISKPVEPPYLKIRVSMFKDPEGYIIELLEWIMKPYGK